jgi:hypothetical protein
MWTKARVKDTTRWPSWTLVSAMRVRSVRPEKIGSGATVSSVSMLAGSWCRSMETAGKVGIYKARMIGAKE